MERIFSVLSVYDFLSYVLSGALVIGGCWWVIGGIPPEPGVATTVALVGAAYVVGHLVQAIGVRWEARYWSRMGGWPSDVRMEPGSKRTFDSGMRAMIDERLARDHGETARKLRTADKFAMARADLRSDAADTQSELMNALYALSRGLTTASALLVLIFATGAISTCSVSPFVWAALVSALSAFLFLDRLSSFGFRFADQVWHDFVASRSPQ